MPDPVVIVRMRQFKAQLLAREAAQMAEMAGRWLQVEEALEAQITALAREMAAMREEGKPVTRPRLLRMRRYQRLLSQARAQFERYAAYAAGLIERQQLLLAQLGLEHAVEATQLSFWPGVGAYFDRLPLEAVEYMAGLAGDGSPLRELLVQRMTAESGALERLTRTLLEGTALGWNPRKTARAMAGDLAAGLQKALTIARTEQLRVYRLAGLEQYRRSGLVTGMRRLCAHDSRVCVACLADEKTVYPLSALIPDHPVGRCGQVPIVEGMPALDWLGGEDWFISPDAESMNRIMESGGYSSWEQVQRDILGPGRYEAWKAGQFEFSQLVTHRQDPVWGGSIHPTPLAKLVS